MIKLAVRIDELLERPVQGAGRGRIHHMGQEFVGQRRSAGRRTITVDEGLIEQPMNLLEARFHAESTAQGLYAFNGERVAIGQHHPAARSQVGNGGDALAIVRIAHVILHGFGFHAREGMRVYVIRIGRHMRNAAVGEARCQSLGEQRQIAQRQESTVALPEGDPLASAERGQTQMFEVTDD